MKMNCELLKLRYIRYQRQIKQKPLSIGNFIIFLKPIWNMM